jgi:Rrf2 family iron-sulfur cluster assembly transcriptional regulator
MQVHTKSRIAIAAILDVAIHGTKEPVSLARVSERQRVSKSYLEHLFNRLRLAGFVIGFRGPGGGYQLNRGLATISVTDVIKAVDGDQESGTGNSDRIGGHHKHRAQVADELWGRVDDHLHNYLRTVTLESVLAEARMPENSCLSCTPLPSVLPAEPSPSRHESRVAALA